VFPQPRPREGTGPDREIKVPGNRNLRRGPQQTRRWRKIGVRGVGRQRRIDAGARADLSDKSRYTSRFGRRRRRSSPRRLRRRRSARTGNRARLRRNAGRSRSRHTGEGCFRLDPGSSRGQNEGLAWHKASPCGGGDREAIGGGSFRIEGPGCGRLPITPPTVGCADTSPTGEALGDQPLRSTPPSPRSTPAAPPAPARSNAARRWRVWASVSSASSLRPWDVRRRFLTRRSSDAGLGADQAHLHQLAQRRVQGLLADGQQVQQAAHRDVRPAADEIEDAVMHPPQAPPLQNSVRTIREAAISEIELLDRSMQIVRKGRIIQVNHIDTIGRRLIVSIGQGL
jgi:hypothetical protein